MSERQYTVKVWRSRGVDIFQVYERIPNTSCDMVYWNTCDKEMRMYPLKAIARVVITDSAPASQADHSARDATDAGIGKL